MFLVLIFKEISFENVSFSYEGSNKKALDDVTVGLSIYARDVYCNHSYTESIKIVIQNEQSNF